MNERQRQNHPESQRLAQSSGDLFGGGIFATTAREIATVTHGINNEQLPVAGLTVAQIRDQLGDRFDIDPDSDAFIQGNPVDDQTVLRTGQTLTFARKGGEKGRAPRLLAG